MTVQETLNHAAALLKNGNTEQAKQAVRPLICNDKAKPFALMVMGASLEKEGDLAAAVYLYRSAVALLPDRNDWRARWSAPLRP